MVKYGSRIKQARLKSKLTQLELSEKIKISQPALAKIESDTTENISLNIAKKIALALDIDFGELFDIDNIQNKEYLTLKKNVNNLKNKLSEVEEISNSVLKFAAFTSFQTESIKNEFNVLKQLIKNTKAINKKEINLSIQKLEILFTLTETNNVKYEDVNRIVRVIRTILSI